MGGAAGGAALGRGRRGQVATGVRGAPARQPDAVAFGDAVRRLRRAAGQTQEVLAERSGCDPSYVSQVELGKRNPSLTKVVGLARGLGVAPGELVAAAFPA